MIFNSKPTTIDTDAIASFDDLPAWSLHREGNQLGVVFADGGERPLTTCVDLSAGQRAALMALLKQAYESALTESDEYEIVTP